MNLATIGNRIRRDLSRHLLRGELNTVAVIFHYEAGMTDEEGEADPWLESEAPEPGEACTATVNAFVHFVSPESVVQRGYTEIAVGDAIVDFAHDVNLEAYRNLRYEINGQFWEQKQAGKELTQAWDVIAGGLPTSRTVLLTLSR